MEGKPPQGQKETTARDKLHPERRREGGGKLGKNEITGFDTCHWQTGDCACVSSFTDSVPFVIDLCLLMFQLLQLSIKSENQVASILSAFPYKL